MNQQKKSRNQYFIKGLLENDVNVIEEIYKENAQTIINFIKNNNGTTEDARDIFQDSLIAIYEKAVKGGLNISTNFDAFLYGVCRNKWIDQLRKKSRSPEIVTDIDNYRDIKEKDLLDSILVSSEQEKTQLFYLKFKELNEGCQQLLQLSWTGASMTEVAKKLNVTYNYVGKKKSNCIAKLIKLVKSSTEYKELKN